MIDAFLLARSGHGFLGVLAIAALWHPALMRLPRFWNVLPATLLTVASFGYGWLIYPTYRTAVKPRLMQHAWAFSQAFEVKEHLAFCAAVLSLGGLGLWYLREGRLARQAYALAAGLGTVVVVLGWLVTSVPP